MEVILKNIYICIKQKRKNMKFLSTSEHLNKLTKELTSFNNYEDYKKSLITMEQKRNCKVFKQFIKERSI